MPQKKNIEVTKPSAAPLPASQPAQAPTAAQTATDNAAASVNKTSLPQDSTVDVQNVGMDKEVTSAEVERLKESVLEQKLQMRLLRHLTKKDGIGGGSTKISIGFQSEMSTRYQIYSLVYKIDGETVYSFFYGDAVGKSEADRKPKEYSQPLAPGTHTLEIQVVHTGNDSGVFAYLNDYKILTEKKVTFELAKETQTKIEVITYEKGWILTDFKERPDLKIKINGSLIP